MEIQKFIAPDNCEVRTTLIDGDPWMSAGDICTALGISDMRQAVERLDDDERGVFTVPTPGGPQSIRAVSESGMYSLILQSRKPEAKAFKRWITHEVLPQIRKTGAYHALPQTFAEALQLAADQARTIDAQAAQIAAAAPAVAFVERFVEAKSSKSLSDVAKVLGRKPRSFIDWLISEGILFRRSGSIIPFQVHLDAGRFEVKAGEEHGHAFTQTRFTTLGVEWIAKRVRFETKAA